MKKTLVLILSLLLISVFLLFYFCWQNTAKSSKYFVEDMEIIPEEVESIKIETNGRNLGRNQSFTVQDETNILIALNAIKEWKKVKIEGIYDMPIYEYTVTYNLNDGSEKNEVLYYEKGEFSLNPLLRTAEVIWQTRDLFLISADNIKEMRVSDPSTGDKTFILRTTDGETINSIIKIAQIDMFLHPTKATAQENDTTRGIACYGYIEGTTNIDINNSFSIIVYKDMYQFEELCNLLPGLDKIVVE